MFDEQLKKAMHFSRHVTASMGKFQPMLKGEKEVKGYGLGVLKQDTMLLGPTPQKEASKMIKMAERLKNKSVKTDAQQMKQVHQELAME